MNRTWHSISNNKTLNTCEETKKAVKLESAFNYLSRQKINHVENDKQNNIQQTFENLAKICKITEIQPEYSELKMYN